MEEELTVEIIINNLKTEMLYKDECVRCFKENVKIKTKLLRLMKTEFTFA